MPNSPSFHRTMMTDPMISRDRKDVPGENHDVLVTDASCEVFDPTIDSEIVKRKASGADVPVIAVTDLTCRVTFLAQDLLEKQDLLERIARSSC